ncbi:cytidylyltransferase domain-containing protein [Geobacillus sp. C56-T2]|uniref:cytidylyltransferase domain-containing protein n=1 Tax=Geobacillus sp. C56-T2 TaxID=600773 RepID=UPI0011A935BA|nr:glycosyltransferase family protein [Geobacillus sp. C56-T2]NNV07982.1 acylneuraminate cytidylyltransferase [Geobacillus sp. MMMUD3]TWG31869.1 spore coat polysaccharide biosynthesis protein SpsF [Geobacillus sp. C56-T2]
MKTLIIIQARMGSSRLLGKVLMPLGDTVVLDYVVSRCQQVKQADEVIVATSVLPQDDVIESWCKQHHVRCFRGSEDDVLARYYECAKPYQPDYVIRVTADCPFVDYELADRIIEAMEVEPADIVIVEGDLPRGLVVEMVSFSALEYIYHHGKESRHREHVTYYAYEFPDEFKRTYIQALKTIQQPQLRITLDTEEDYQLCAAVANHFKKNKLISSQKVVQFLLEHPDIAKLNAHIQQKPVI